MPKILEVLEVPKVEGNVPKMLGVLEMPEVGRDSA